MADTAYFTPELFEFLRQLRRRNNREWFAAHKARYESAVRDPALRMIAAFAPYLYRLSPYFVADPRPARGSLFRIYRDTRFAADKRPYKTHVGIHFSHQAGKDAHAPVFYLHLEPENCFAAAGIWHPDNPALNRVRAAIVGQPAEWAKVRRNLELEGASLARPPRGYDPRHPMIEDLKRKDFITSIGYAEAEVCRPQFLREFFTACKSMAPLVRFTTLALGLKY